MRSPPSRRVTPSRFCSGRRKISHLIERQLAEVGSGRVRLELAGLGLDRDGIERWIPRLEALSVRLAGPRRTEAASLLAVLYLRLADHGPADVLLAQIAASASEATLGTVMWLGERLVTDGEPERATTILQAASSAIPPEGRLRWAVALDSSYNRAGQSQSAVTLWQSVVRTLATALGPDHPHTLTSQSLLGDAYFPREPEKAVQTLDACLADQERVLVRARAPRHSSYPLGCSDSPHCSGKCGTSHADDRRARDQRLRRRRPPRHASASPNDRSRLRSDGSDARSLDLLEANLTDCACVLGPDDRQTIATRGTAG